MADLPQQPQPLPDQLIPPMIPLGLPRHPSAFAAVLGRRKYEEVIAATSALPATPVEVEKRKQLNNEEDLPPTSHAKKTRLETSENCAIMPLPPSAQSNLCQQRAKESLETHRKLSEASGKPIQQKRYK